MRCRLDLKKEGCICLCIIAFDGKESRLLDKIGHNNFCTVVVEEEKKKRKK